MVCVPVQGFATVTGGCCAREQMRAKVIVPVHEGATAADHAPCEQHVPEHASEPSKHEQMRKQCHCASCGLGAVAPPPQVDQSFDQCPHMAALVLAISPFFSFIPSGPERPPKFPL